MLDKLILENIKEKNAIFDEYGIQNRVKRIEILKSEFLKLKNCDNLSNKEYVQLVEKIYNNDNLYNTILVSIPGRINEKIHLIVFGENVDLIDDNINLKNIKNRNDFIIVDIMPYPMIKNYSILNTYHWNSLIKLIKNNFGKQSINDYENAKKEIVENEDKIYSYKRDIYKKILTKDKLDKDYLEFINNSINILKESVDDYYACIKSNEDNIRKLSIRNDMIENEINHVKTLLFKIDEY